MDSTNKAPANLTSEILARYSAYGITQEQAEKFTAAMAGRMSKLNRDDGLTLRVIEARLKMYAKELRTNHLTKKECVRTFIGKSPELLPRDPMTIIGNVRLILAMRKDNLVKFKPSKGRPLISKLLGRPPIVTMSKESYLLKAFCAAEYNDPYLLHLNNQVIRKRLEEAANGAYKTLLDLSSNGQKIDGLKDILAGNDYLAAMAAKMPNVIAQYQLMCGQDPISILPPTNNGPSRKTARARLGQSSNTPNAQTLPPSQQAVSASEVPSLPCRVKGPATAREILGAFYMSPGL